MQVSDPSRGNRLYSSRQLFTQLHQKTQANSFCVSFLVLCSQADRSLLESVDDQKSTNIQGGRRHDKYEVDVDYVNISEEDDDSEDDNDDW